MTSRIIAIVLVIIVIALGAWYILANQDFTSSLSQTSISTSTVPAQVAQEASPAPTLDQAAVAQNVVGSWQSTDDPNYAVTITAGGKWTDSYKGADASSSVSETGTYELFTSQDPDKDFTGVLVPGVVYVKVVEGTSVLYFSVLEADGSNLQLSYLDRGNTLSFVKEQ